MAKGAKEGAPDAKQITDRWLYRTTPEQDRYKLRQDTDSVSIDRAYEFIRIAHLD